MTTIARPHLDQRPHRRALALGEGRDRDQP